MRIVGGQHRGRTLKAPTGREVRPTSDRTRESMFNILAHGIDDFELSDASVLDLFCGTGALGLEALSRGATHATFIDSDAKSLALAKENAATVGEWRNVTLLKIDSRRLGPPPLAAKAPCSLAFLDAPYEQNLTGPALLTLVNNRWLAEGAIVVVEVAQMETLDPPRQLKLLNERVYGAAKVLFLKYQP
jgi:16S rRNA (guanine966-N2)-methyltransferase